MSLNALVPTLFGIGGLVVAHFIYQKIKEYPTGDAKITQISDAIHRGAMVFMRREYTFLGGVCRGAVFCLVVSGSDLGPRSRFIVGALASAGAGYIGMSTATRANVRTTTAAHSRGAAEASHGSLLRRIHHGSRGGLVGSAGARHACICFLAATPRRPTPSTALAWALPASRLFSRVGGGIFTKSADVGADLVGKLEAGIPEDDPRNPGVIADNVGDNVGDVAGMGSDIFESYCGAMIATIAMASTLTVDVIDPLGERCRVNVPAVGSRVSRSALLHRRDLDRAPLLGSEPGHRASLTVPSAPPYLFMVVITAGHQRSRDKWCGLGRGFEWRRRRHRHRSYDRVFHR